MEDQAAPQPEKKPPGIYQRIGQWIEHLAKGETRIPFVKSARKLALGLFQDDLIFTTDVITRRIRPPGDYAIRYPKKYPALKEFKEEFLRTSDGVDIALWHRPPKDPDQPVYVVFHGQGGHWGDAGDKPGHDDTERLSRLDWLQAMADHGGWSKHYDKLPPEGQKLADSGAEIIAVHLRGYGASRERAIKNQCLGHMKPTERGIQRDIDAIADYLLGDGTDKKPGLLKKRGIGGEHTIVCGGSLGGGSAAKLSSQMTERGQPPAVFGSIASFSSMKNCAADIFKVSAEELRGLKHQFDTKSHVKKLRPEETYFYIAHNRQDEVIPFAHAEDLFKSAPHGEKHKVLHELVSPANPKKDPYHHHANWEVVPVIQRIRQLYEAHAKTRMGQKADIFPFNSNGEASANGNGHYGPGTNGTGRNGTYRH